MMDEPGIVYVGTKDCNWTLEGYYYLLLDTKDKWWYTLFDFQNGEVFYFPKQYFTDFMKQI